MYKKISHNIVEEHFDRPEVLPTTVSAGLRVSSQPTVNRYVAFQNSLITFDEDLRSYIKSELFDTADNSFNWAQLAISIGLISDTYPEAGPFTARRTITDQLTAYVNSIKDLIVLVKSGQDFNIQKSTALSHLSSLFIVFSSINVPQPKNNTEIVITLTEYNQCIVDQIVARKIENWADDYIAAAQARTSIISIANIQRRPYY